MPVLDDIDFELIGRHIAVEDAEAALERAKERRALAFALANEKGKSPDHIAVLTRATPSQVQGCLRIGHGLLGWKRRKAMREAA